MLDDATMSRHEFIDGVHYVTAAPNIRHLIVQLDRFDVITMRNIKGTPTIVVEVLSPSTAKLLPGFELPLSELFSDELSSDPSRIRGGSRAMRLAPCRAARRPVARRSAIVPSAP